MKDTFDLVVSLQDSFDWAVTPCLAEFEPLSPAPPPLEIGQLTLSYFLASTWFYCELAATDEVLAPGQIQLDPLWPSQSSEDVWTTSFPSFRPAEITVIYDDPEHPFESNYSRVRIGQQQLNFIEAMDVDDEVAKKEVEMHERIARATNLGPGVRTSRLYGVVRNARDQLLGLLLYSIEKDKRLSFALGPDTPNALKDRWARQIRDTVAALHEAGIVWGDVKRDDVLIDVHGDAWIVDFGGGRTEGWVDADTAGTVDGAIGRISEFIASGGGFNLTNVRVGSVGAWLIDSEAAKPQ
ncbi:hypothetical protein N658DRAFT_509630 [Parathielavia hyrcaniae]|uniref:Protein kinase domain-containing protein n=1 Tax=Parathielavia hyrcaniae TaxID=113614 RepID=A0AAN6SYA6_9PEZI|nr:hypothetical protein N658DRAFT_509630 [Parathielavia hyrcaniae]